MSFSVTEFNNQYTGDYARQNLFLVDIDKITAIAGGNSGGGMFVKAGSLPEATVGMVEVPYQNRKLKIPGDRTFNDWTATVIQDEGYELRNQLLDWQKDITGFSEFKTEIGPGAAHRKINILPYNRNGTPATTQQANVYGWPSAIGAVELSWESEAVQEYTVTFQISWDDGGIWSEPKFNLLG